MKNRVNIKNLVSDQLPSFVRDGYSEFVEFLKDYYDSLEFPGGPVDILNNIDEYTKLNNITEGRLLLMDIELKSRLSDDVSFVYDFETLVLSNPYKKGWWMDSTTNISDVKCTNKKEKIVKLIKSSDWSNAQLDWAEKVSKPMEILFNSDNDKQP